MRILILGASGMIGHRMWATLSSDHETIGVLRRPALGDLALIPGISLSNSVLSVEAHDLPKISKVIQDTKPDVVLNCIGIVKQLKDSHDHLKSISINSLFPHQLAKVCADNNARMIHLSSDCVFDGVKGHYIESDFQNAQDLYGKSKTLGEIDYLENVLTIRTSSIGREVFPHGGLLEWFLGNRGKTIAGFSKVIYSGLTTKTLANVISQNIFTNPELSGVLHVAGLPIDKWSLLKLIQEHFNLKMEITVDKDFTLDRSLDYSEFTKKTMFQAPTWSSMMKDLEVDFDIYESLRNKRV
ncbi:MAG: SDR family oxidoreductase [Bacteriovorax sp.]|nr:SDR family oxidoreductase [Bacteriovorax sp.]